MEVGGNNTSYPGGALSNFSGHAFELDGVRCASMEGFLQSLKFEEPDVQRMVCGLVGIAAKRRGRPRNTFWQRTQTLWWQGVRYRRSSHDYQRLLDRAYDAMYTQSDAFRRALYAAGRHAVFTHSIGRTNERETVLTQAEFCRRLHRLRDRLYEEDTK